MQRNGVHTIIPDLLQLCLVGLYHAYHSSLEQNTCYLLFYVNVRVHEGLRSVNRRSTSANLCQGCRRFGLNVRSRSAETSLPHVLLIDSEHGTCCYQVDELVQYVQRAQE